MLITIELKGYYVIEQFISQDEELEAFITGPAGSGKTTNLAETIEYLNKQKITYQVVAYTHKAKDVLITKLPENTPISTLHSWLKKRPGINEKATHIRTLLTSKQYGKPEHLELLVVDEFSFVGEKDYFSIGELQDETQLEAALEVEVSDCCQGSISEEDRCECCGKICGAIDYLPKDAVVPKPLKVLYVGDLNQLSPIEGPPAVEPIEPFWTKLTTIYRQGGEGLKEPLELLVKMIEGTIPVAYLEPTVDFLRKRDIVYDYKLAMQEIVEPKCMMLAWTNEAVQRLNAEVQGREFPIAGDMLFNFSMKTEVEFDRFATELTDDMELTTVNGLITKDTKYNPFKELRKNRDIIYIISSRGCVIPAIFGVFNNKIKRNKIGQKLTLANKQKASEVTRKNAYKAYKVVTDYVSIVDFTHCKTIHTSQGQECDRVYIDASDLSKNRNLLDRLKLLYVGMSRAKDKILLNN